MGVKVATTGLHWSHPSATRSPSSSQTLASAISSPSSKRRSICCSSSSSSGAQALCRYVHCLDRSSFFGGASYSNLYRTGSWEYPRARTHVIKRACSARLDAFSDEEFSKKIQELASRFQVSSDEEANLGRINPAEDADETSSSIISSYSHRDSKSLENRRSFEPPDWDNEIIPPNIERKANSVDLPFSLRIIKRKKQWDNGFREAGESAYCSVKKAFSSMVFIIRELQCYTLQMREMLFYEDLQGILARVQKEMHMSFVWLFQQVFSHTPTLMVYVMILLANYSVYSMANNSAIACSASAQPYAAAAAAATESVSPVDGKEKFDSSVMKTFSVSSSSSSSGKTTSIGGSNGGGGRYRPVASGTEGDGSFERVSVFSDGVSSIGKPSISGEEEEEEEEAEEGCVSGQVNREEEMRLWNSIVDEASKMQSAGRDDSLDHETMMRFVSPINAKMEADDYSDYVRTELVYRLGLSLEPNNPLLLANYAQFLYLVVRDFKRAEEYFKRAGKVEPKDADALDKYASFLWKAKNDLWGAEETYLEAISADPSNSYYAANYAHFLWTTGGEDTCYPLDS